MTDDRLRVLVVGASLTGGGAERFTSTLLTHLDRSRFEPHLCVMQPEISYSLPPDVPLISLGKRHSWHLPRTIVRLRRAIVGLRPDVILGTMLSTSWIIGASLIGMRNRPRWIARFAASPAWEFDPSGPHGPAGPLVGWAVGRLTGSADRWVANSRGLAREVCDFFGAPSSVMQVLLNPVDFDQIDRLAAEPCHEAAGDDRPVVISVGRLTQQKRPDLLLEAFARIREAGPTSLWFVGDGPLRGALTRRVEELGLMEDVRILGFLENPYPLMRHATVFALSSDYEGLPNSLIEAQGLGLPVVSTRCPSGPEEIIEEGKTGILVEVGDARALAEALGGLLSRPERAREMGREARRQSLQSFAWRQVMPAWERLLGEAVEAESCAA